MADAGCPGKERLEPLLYYCHETAVNAPTDTTSSALARRAMVECQLRPQAVIDREVLAAMDTVAREKFVPAVHAARAYADRLVPLGGGRFLSPPVVTGRLLSELEPRAGQRALVIGSASGYSAALLAYIGLDVTAVDTMDPLVKVPGVNFIKAPLPGGWPAGAPYDLILIDGAVDFVPDALSDQLAPDGRIGAVLRERGVDRLVTGRRAGTGFGFRSVMDAEAADVPGFERPQVFTF